uniref:Uncharacterized protein n=1 Tax=viral metagenome TaxID=1070528 RepID=A0A6M3KAU5_9ZZZZ
MTNTEINGLSKKRQDTAQRIITALKETRGLLTMAARKAGVSYTTVKRYATEFPSIKEAVQESKESMVDFAEGKLFEKISKGDTACIIFYLKTQGKGRGYIERQEFTGEGGGPVKHEITVVSETAKKLTEEVLNGKGTE